MAWAALAVAVGTAPAMGADKAQLLRKMESLERQQQMIQQQMQEIREELGMPAAAPAAAGAEGGRVQEVERRQDILTDEVRVLKEALVLPETRELKSTYGLGPAASKVYGINQGLSIGGYGEFNYREGVSDSNGGDEFDALRLVLYTGYKFNDWIVFNSEVEFEHGSTGSGGSVSVEFMTLDFLLHPMANLRAGLVLVPMGFINEIHEPPFFHGNVRPQVEQQIIPSTWRANGAGLFGELLPGLEYRTYAITGLDAADFRSNGIRSGRQNGAFEKAEDWAWVGRLDYSPVDMLMVGGSAYLGNSGHDQKLIDVNPDGNPDTPDDVTYQPDVFTQIYEAHAQFRGYGLEVRALGAYTSLGDARKLSLVRNEPIASEQYGWYGEIAYDVLPLIRPGTRHYLAPWFRYSQFDTQSDVPFGFAADDTLDRDIWELGLSYKPIPQVIIKADYRNQDSSGGRLADEIRLGAGFAF